MRTKIFFAALFYVAVSSSLYAQLEKGRKMLGGSLSFTTQEVESGGSFIMDVNSFTLDFTSKFGKLFSNKLALGLNLSYKYTGQSSSSEHKILGGPFIRYFIPIKSNAAFFEYSIATGKLVGTSNYSPEPFYLNNSLSAGYQVFINEHIAIEGCLQYYLNYISYKYLDSYQTLNAYGNPVINYVQAETKKWKNGTGLFLGLQIYI